MTGFKLSVVEVLGEVTGGAKGNKGKGKLDGFSGSAKGAGATGAGKA
ncbi:glycine dehydrogenase subunit 2 [Aphanothece sacrum FPU3]|nr:glycine dehydrogenase subunit 2 [Aphanothece sacrum FPU3]